MMTNSKKNRLETDDVLSVLREINSNPQLTQRDLSVRLGFSLGKVNFLIKALIEKGFIKAGNFKNSKNKMAYLYCLTPKGIEQKADITYRFLKRKITEYGKLQQEIRQLEKEVDLLDIPDADRK